MTNAMSVLKGCLLEDDPASEQTCDAAYLSKSKECELDETSSAEKCTAHSLGDPCAAKESSDVAMVDNAAPLVSTAAKHSGRDCFTHTVACENAETHPTPQTVKEITETTAPQSEHESIGAEAMTSKSSVGADAVAEPQAEEDAIAAKRAAIVASIAEAKAKQLMSEKVHPTKLQ